jgi:hypothetical protein
MVEININEKDIASSLNRPTLNTIIFEFLEKQNLSKDLFLKELSSFLDEESYRRIIYSYSFVDYCISLFETKNSFKENLEYSSVLKKANVFNKNIFENIMKETQTEFGYNFGFIQDQIWYALYPKYL